MSEQLTPNDSPTKAAQRYHRSEVIEHLANQYVLGTLTARVHRKVETLAKHNALLEQRISYWQQRFVTLDLQTPELPPSEVSWQKITEQLESNEVTSQLTCDVTPQIISQTNKGLVDGLRCWLFESYNQLTSGFSATTFASITAIALLASVTLLLLNPLEEKTDPLSYVAVLTKQNGQAHLVATTYGESKKLVVNIVKAPKVEANQSLELWVVSKTDTQARSLGLIPVGKTLIEQQLTTAQWRLIKDSDSLIVTIEELGGSPIGEPSELIVSRGLCVRLQEWKKNA